MTDKYKKSQMVDDAKESPQQTSFVPNEETIKAMEAARRGDVVQVQSARELITALEDEE